MSVFAHVMQEQFAQRADRLGLTHEGELLVDYDDGSESPLQLCVRYRVMYASVRDRGFGRDPQITIRSCTVERGVQRVDYPMSSTLEDYLLELIEERELLLAPFED